MGRRIFGCAVPFLLFGGVLFAVGSAGAAYLVTALPGEVSSSPLRCGPLLVTAT